MAGADDEEEVLFDQAGLLNLQLKQPRSSHWCRKFIKTICLSLAFFSLVCTDIIFSFKLIMGERSALLNSIEHQIYREQWVRQSEVGGEQ